MLKKFNELSLTTRIIAAIVIAVVLIVKIPVLFGMLVMVGAIIKIVSLLKQEKYVLSIPFFIIAIFGFAFAAVSASEENGNYDSNYVTNTATPEATEEPEVTEEPIKTAEPEENLPEYEVDSVEDTDIGSVKRRTLNIVVTGEYTLDDLYKIAKKEISTYIAKNDVNAVTAGFYTDASHIGNGYDMGRVEYVPNGDFSEAVNVTAGDYSTFEYVDKLTEALVLPKGEELQDGATDVEQVKADFEDVYDGCEVTVTLKSGTLYVTVEEPEDNPYTDADENAISEYTDWGLENINSDVKYLDITVIRPSSSASALLDMSDMLTDNGRYFDLFYIIDNMK